MIMDNVNITFMLFIF